MGLVLKGLDQPSDAALSYRKAVALKPDYPEALSNLGNILLDRGDPGDAIECFEKALSLKPDFAEAHNNLGKAQMDIGSHGAAEASFSKALSLRAGYDNAEYNRSLLLLLRGDFPGGWAGYQKRLVEGSPLALPDRGFRQPLCDGSDLSGKRILLYEEQGVGDSIQFIRYAKTLSDKGAHVIVECQPDLKALLATAPGVKAVFLPPQPMPGFDVHTPLLSLPYLCGADMDSLPADVPYLSGEGGWELPVPGDINIGLVWAGNPDHKNDRNRSIDVARFKPLLGVMDTRFYGLQVGAAPQDPAKAGIGEGITDLSPRLVDYAETAAAIAALDLVISVDTSVAHLAGAMATPVWLLLPKVPDFRWMLDRDDSPGYPTMRLFRQPEQGDWDSVFEAVAARLKTGRGGF